MKRILYTRIFSYLILAATLTSCNGQQAPKLDKTEQHLNDVEQRLNEAVQQKMQLKGQLEVLEKAKQECQVKLDKAASEKTSNINQKWVLVIAIFVAFFFGVMIGSSAKKVAAEQKSNSKEPPPDELA